MKIDNLRALFITTPTNDVDKLVGAWDCFATVPAARWLFDPQGAPTDQKILTAVSYHRPDVVFYIGANEGRGLPGATTLRKIAKDKPFVHICCDAGDWPWHAVLKAYRAADCFTRQVSIDGHQLAPVDLVTLTPVDLRPFDSKPAPARVNPAGWAGNIGSDHRRELVGTLSAHNLIHVRQRDTSDYHHFAHFLRSCRLIVNSAITGTTTTKHVKGRVLEAAFAGCALLEMDDAPTHHWIPTANYFQYRDSDHAAKLLHNLSFEEVDARAKALGRYVRDHYHPRMIYAAMLDGLV